MISHKKYMSRSLRRLGNALFFGLLFVGNPLQLHAVKEEEADFTLTDSDIRKLNLNDSEAQELRQFFDALNNLSPEDKQELAELGEKTEKKMKSKKYEKYNFDPTNFDDIVKFMELEEKELKEEEAKKKAEEAVEKVEKPKVPEKKPEITVTSMKEVLPLLKDIERKIESLVVKTKTRETLNQKLSKLQLELSEFRYFIRILQAPDLVLLLASKDFGRLRKNLEKLHKVLAAQEPIIIARKLTGDVDDPYQMLGIEYSATPGQITQAYQAKKASQSPEAVKKALKDRKLTEKDKRKFLKEADLTWSFIQDAYDELIDANRRALVRKELKNQIDEEARHQKISKAAFDKIYDALYSAFYPDAVLSDIRMLLEKHKPQELEQAKKIVEAEKKAAEEMKKRQAVRLEVTPTRPTTEQPYEAFYQKMAQESYQKPVYPIQPPAAPSAERMAEEKEAAAGGKKAEKGKKKEGKKEEKKEEKKETKEERKERKKEEAKEYGKAIGKIDALEAWLKGMEKTKGNVAITRGRRAAAEEEEEEEGETVPLAQVMRDVATDLRAAGRAPVAASDAAKTLRSYFDKHKFKDNLKHFKDLAPGLKAGTNQPAKELQENICTEWEKRIWKPFGEKLIRKWHKDIFEALSFPRGKINAAKAKAYGIKFTDTTPQELFKKEEKKPAAAKTAKTAPKPAKEEEKPAVNLGEIGDTIHRMYLYCENINAACVKKKGAAKPGEKKESEKKEEEDEEEDEDE